MSVFGPAEQPTVAKLNQKTVLCDTGANIAAAAAYKGMLAYCTTTGSGFLAGRYYSYNSTAWQGLGVVSYVDIIPKMWGLVIPVPASSNSGFAQVSNQGPVYFPTVTASSLTEPLMLSQQGGTSRPIVEFSQMNPIHAYFEIWALASNGITPTTDTMQVDLYDITHSAEITGTALSATSSTSQYVKMLSADIAANLPTSDSVLTVRAYDSTTTTNTINIAMARLKLMF